MTDDADDDIKDVVGEEENAANIRAVKEEGNEEVELSEEKMVVMVVAFLILVCIAWSCCKS